MTDPVLDEAHLDRQTFGDAELKREITGMFRQQAAEIVAAIEAAQGGAVTADLAHRLKGSARAVGAFRLAEVADEIERDGWTAAVPLRAALVEVMAALDRLDARS